MHRRRTIFDTDRRVKLDKEKQVEDTEQDDEYPFVCDDQECNRRYKSEGALARHKGQKHLENEEKE